MELKPKLTWRSPEEVIENQIDHVAIITKWRSVLQDTTVQRSADAGSGLHLVVAEIKMKLLTVKKPKSAKTKYCTSKLSEQSVKDDFVIALANRYEVLYNADDDKNMAEFDLEEDWTQIKEMYTSKCEEVLGKKVYDTTRLLRGKRNIQSKPVKDRNGKVLTKIEEKLTTSTREPNGPPRG